MSAAGFTLPLYDKHIDAEHASRSVKSGIPRLSIKTPVVLLEDGQSGVDGCLTILQLAVTALKSWISGAAFVPYNPFKR